ncbi:hypothetical protein EG68_02591 [Paragonimus skrjabini miyazakii]|uniref:Uncharacterized protein n=1 Tax=Paragonimus skrjabini miyazakii TaxID=59628 RepID=A0A8S9Z9U6_9TREM|nr:hypothetical protein EG68_02591 [Paragonimus skrjabini miyazakii]
MEVEITFNNSMLVANDIYHTCPPFKELDKASLDSPLFYSSTKKKSDGRSVDTRASPHPEQTSTSNDSITTVRTTTRGGVVTNKDALLHQQLPIGVIRICTSIHIGLLPDVCDVEQPTYET